MVRTAHRTSIGKLMFRLDGKTGLVVGIANEHSIAWGCADAFRRQGAALAVTYLNDKAAPHVRPLAARVEAPVVLPLDVRDATQMDALFDAIAERWGRLDFLLHSIAFCPREDLHGRVVDCSRDGFLTAMDVSVYSFVDLVRRAEPLMTAGGACLTVSYLGADRVMEHYNVMGPVKAALEGVTRAMAADLGPKGIRVNALSPGPMLTRAASGIEQFDSLMATAASRAATRRLATVQDVGAQAAFLVSDAAANLTGGIYYVDGGFNVMG